MKTVLLFLVGIVILGVLNDFYFEYCVSRPMPMFLQTLATVVVFLADLVAIIYTVKKLTKILKL
jgi:uncharacterized protein YqgC (DUF456 family)